MEPAGVEPADSGHPDATGHPGVPTAPPGSESPWIGVPSIPSSSDRGRAPAPVPSVPIPGPAPTAPLQLAPVVPASPWPPASPWAPALASPAVPPGAGPPIDGFPRGVADKLQTYVYLLVDPRTGRPFYVGSGRGDRCYRHLGAARSAPDPGTATDRDAPPKFAMLDRIREVEATGREVRVDILRFGLTDSEASLVEGAARDVLGLQSGGTPDQRRPAAELGARLAKRAKFKRSHQVVLLRVGGKGSDPSYGVARHHWRIGRRWIDVASPPSPQWAVIVVGDLVAGVYRLERWEPTPAPPTGGAAGPTDRYSFVGTPDPDLEDRYRNKSVAAYLGEGATTPVTYVWCGPHWVNPAR